MLHNRLIYHIYIQIEGHVEFIIYLFIYLGGGGGRGSATERERNKERQSVYQCHVTHEECVCVCAQVKTHPSNPCSESLL